MSEYTTFKREPTWVSFIDSLKEELYPVGNYDDQYITWTTFHHTRNQTVPKYTNIFHTLCSKLGVKDSKRHMFLKYHSGMNRYIQT
jgi:hypothetical protein